MPGRVALLDWLFSCLRVRRSGRRAIAMLWRTRAARQTRSSLRRCYRCERAIPAPVCEACARCVRPLHGWTPSRRAAHTWAAAPLSLCLAFNSPVRMLSPPRLSILLVRESVCVHSPLCLDRHPSHASRAICSGLRSAWTRRLAASLRRSRARSTRLTRMATSPS
eukprot:6204301-Pleurochrysis_carterae.AAC.1